MSARVLIVEDEDTLRHAMVRGLAKLPGVHALGASSVQEALAIVDAGAPDLVVSDLDLPDRPGLELIGELGRRGVRCPITFVSAYVRAFSAQIPRHSGVRVLEKPVPLEQLRELVSSELERSGGAPAPFGVAEYLQIACLGGHSVRITVRGHGGAAVGDVVVHRGVLWSARDGADVGIDAFRRLAFVHGASIECHATSGEPGPRAIETSWEAALLDAARALDEDGRDAPIAIDDELTIAIDEPAVDAFDEARDRGAMALLRRDHAAAYEAFLEADRLQPGDRMVAANLARLREMGVGGSEGGPA
ncbi:response regulator [Sandaracinus amylolyticus]|uniref:response regulator n=1 Tax=Sandaracinus amylolyticus TaxID=927083 RepID=UPI001F15C569|nr:response regulator [Sandaracinus amylolyticus]UJR85386.1 Hypothetical protein I5071_74660 [Sandaracinus amylolyticus]